MEFYTQKINDLICSLSTSEIKGLSAGEAKDRLEKYGPNTMEKKEKISFFKLFLSQFKDAIVWVLIAAAVISLIHAIGITFTEGFHLDNYAETIVITAIIFLHAILGFVQEFRAEKSIEALKKLTGLKSNTIRDGHEIRINAEELVPGDIINLSSGDKVPADAQIIELSNLEVSEATLTGESVPVEKKLVIPETSQLSDQLDRLFSGTILTKGRGKALVTSTGMKTELGKIATLLQESEVEQTPLQKKMKQLSKWLGLGILIVCIIVFFAGCFIGTPTSLFEMLMVSVSLAAAAIPAGLSAAITISLALGIQRMIKKNALIRKLQSIETLGSTTVICTDKTGTLTKNEMTTVKLYVNNEVFDSGVLKNEIWKSSGFNELCIMLKIGALCNDSKFDVNSTVIGDPTEACLIIASEKAGCDIEKLKQDYPRVDEIPFDSNRKLMSTIHTHNDMKYIYTKGATEQILKSCSKILINGTERLLPEEQKQKILEQNNCFAKQALRVLSFAYSDKPVGGEDNLVFAGMQAIIDPPRESTYSAVKSCHEAGIMVKMITGDNEITASAIAKEIGIFGKVISGAELDKIEDLDTTVEECSVFARVNPEHKLKIVKALKEKNNIVAMTGDGVNDAPALKAAQIGICVGSGTDVAKESSEMILTTDDFATIISAIEEGRRIYDNIKKFITFLISDNLSEVLTLFIGLMLGFPLPLIAIQLLWLSLIADGFPALALGVEPVSKGIMKRKPRNPDDNIFDKVTIFWMLSVSLIIMTGTLIMFRRHDDLIHGQTVAFTTLFAFQMFHVFNCKSLHQSIFNTFFNNKRLILAVIFSFILQFIIVYIPFFQGFFKTSPMPLFEWMEIILVASSVIWFSEIFKLCLKFFRKA